MSYYDDFPEDFMDEANDTADTDESIMQLDHDDEEGEVVEQVDNAADAGTYLRISAS